MRWSQSAVKVEGNEYQYTVSEEWNGYQSTYKNITKNINRLLYEYQIICLTKF